MNVLVNDYFCFTYRGNTGDEEVYNSRTQGNNGFFYELYMEALNDRKEKDTYYSIDKVLLLKICYTDIHNKKHERCYRFSREIDKEEYYSIYSKGSTIEHSFTLADISYPKLKKILSDITSK